MDANAQAENDSPRSANVQLLGPSEEVVVEADIQEKAQTYPDLDNYLENLTNEKPRTAEEIKIFKELGKEVYRQTRENVAPAYILIADKILNQLHDDPDAIMFALARDGLPISLAAEHLREKQDQFKGIDPKRIQYLHYNGQFNPLVGGTTQDEAFFDRYREYLQQMGVNDAKKVILADSQCAVGLSYKGLGLLLREVNPAIKIEGQFIDLWPNGTNDTHGLLQDVYNPDFHLNVQNNRMQLIEALYSGTKNSATDIVRNEETGQYEPVVADKNPSELTAIRGLPADMLTLLNVVAIKGITDATDDYSRIIQEDPKDVIGRYVQFASGTATEGVQDLQDTIPWQRRKEQWYLYDQYWTDVRKKEWADRPDQIEALKKKHAKTSLPESSMHKPEDVRNFVESYLTEKDIKPREVKLQMIGVKALQNPDIVKRFLDDFKANRGKSSYQGQVGMFIIDDSWDADKAAEIQAVAAEAGVGYFRVRIDEGFADDIIRKFGEKIEAKNNLTDAEKKYHFWLARALLKDRLQAPLAKDIGNFNFTDALAELGGIAGTQNFGYLVSAYEAGKRGVPLEQMTVTINEDDQRYVTLAQDTDGKIITESPDLLAERAAWFEDPDTIATVGRYTGHTGNPISMVKDTLQASTCILSDHNSGKSNTYNIFDPKSGTFYRMSSEDAYKMLPQILRAAAQRQSIIGLWTKDKHYIPLVDWVEASKLDLGNVTLSGAALPSVITPLGGVFDYNFSGLLRAQAVQADDGNRLIRREEALMHHRIGRSSGGDAFGTEIAAAFNNNYAKEQRKISHVLETDEAVRHELMETLGISKDNEELFNIAMRTFDANGRKLQDIRNLRKIFELQVTLAGIQGEQDTEVLTGIKSFLEQFPEGLIDDVEANVIKPPRAEEIKEVRKGIKRFTQMYKVWPDILHTAYEMGAAEGGFTLDETNVTEQQETINKTVPVEVGYLPGVSAHTGRPLEVALKLAESGIPAVMRGGDSGRNVFGLQDTWETSSAYVTVENSSLFYYHPGELIRGVFTVEQMTNNIVEIVKLLKDNPPPFVIVDHNVPLLMAAKAAGVPSVAITNMSNVGFCSDAFIDAIGPTARKLADKYYVPLEPKLQEVYEKVHQRLNNGEAPTDKPNWFQIMETGADLTLIADCAAFVEDGISDDLKMEPMLKDLTRGNFVYVGSIQPDTLIDQSIDQDATGQALLRMEEAKIAGNKVVLGSFGSIRKPELYEALFAVARNNPNLLMVVTIADAELPDDIPQNFLAVKFGKLTKLAKHADVMLCQGGSGTLYPFMKEGNGGIINITTNADQQYNAALIEQHGLGHTLPIETLTADILEDQVRELIKNQGVYQANMGKISEKIDLGGAQNAATMIKQKFNL